MTPQHPAAEREDAGLAALLGRITSLRHHDNVDAAYECHSGIDRCHECVVDYDVAAALRAAAHRPDVGGLREALAAVRLSVKFTDRRTGADMTTDDVASLLAAADNPSPTGPCPRCGRPDSARSCPNCYSEFAADNPTPEPARDTLRADTEAALEGMSPDRQTYWRAELGSQRALAAPGDARAIVEALGFDPTNHHNAAKCPYCAPLPIPTAARDVACTDHVGASWCPNHGTCRCGRVVHGDGNTDRGEAVDDCPLHGDGLAAALAAPGDAPSPIDSATEPATIDEQGLAANRIDSSAPVVRARPSGSGRCDWRA